MLVCAFSKASNAHETAGAARTRSSLRPLLRVACALFFGGRERNGMPRTKPVARMRSHVSSSPPSAQLRTGRGDPSPCVRDSAVRRLSYFTINARGDGSPRSRGRQNITPSELHLRAHRKRVELRTGIAGVGGADLLGDGAVQEVEHQTDVAVEVPVQRRRIDRLTAAG